MKIRWNSDYTLRAIYASIVIAILVLCIFIGINYSVVFGWLGRVLTFCSPILYGFIIAYLCNPVMKFFEKRVFRFLDRKKPHPRLRRALSMTVTYLLYSILIALFLLLILPQIVQSYNDLQAKMSGYVSSAQEWVTSFISSAKNSALLGYFDFSSLIDGINDLISNSYKIVLNVTPYVLDYVGRITNQLKNALLGIIFSLYFLADKEKLIAQVKKVLHALFSKERVRRILEFSVYTDRTFGGFILGKIEDSLIIGVLTFITLAVFRMPYYPLISVIICVTNIIPFFGPFIGAIPSIFFIFIADPMKALWFTVIILVIQQIDGNIIGPKIIGVSTGLDSLGVIVAITLMSGLFGIPGMFFGVPLFSLILYVINTLIRRRLHKRGLPHELSAYYDRKQAMKTAPAPDPEPPIEAEDPADPQDGEVGPKS